jgi:hypothetical protein
MYTARFASLALMVVTLPASAATNYVSPTGNDSNPGTLASPWRTIQKAANTLAPGDTALVRGGIYSEAVTVNVSGSSINTRITFQNYPGEIPIVDGTGLIVPAADTGLFLIVNRSNLTLQGFEIRNYKTNSNSRVPSGIWISGTARDLNIFSNNVHHIENTNKNGNAFGIVAYGTSATQPISGLVFRGNEVHHLKTGNSESFTLNGNVTHFEVSGNLVHDNNNIGIDFIGYEGSSPDPATDRARNGVCRDNTVWNISSYGNAAYGNEYSAGGIYCDGATDIVIERNRVFACDIGIELASEHAGRSTSLITVRDNLVWSNRTGGIFIGGYDTQRGRTEFCELRHNTLYRNDTLQHGNGEVYLQFDTRSNVFTHNILVANSQNLFIGNPFPQNSNNIVNWNLYFAPGGTNNSEWQWKNVTRTGFSTYKTATSNDSNSIFADPRFIDAAAANFHLATSSPALNAGDPTFVPASGETDIDDQPRVAGPRVDIGADELNVFSPKLGITPPAGKQLRLQLDGEPGHAVVWEQSDTLASWLPFLTNSNATGRLEISNTVTVATRFFRARMVE